MNSAPTPAKRPHFFYVGLLVLLTLWMSLPGLSHMPVIDRDEARYAQATVQMVESDDYLNIKFQDRARNKKPAGIYWFQAGSVKALTEPGERAIWAHRLPSVLGALIAVLATYWAGIHMLGRRGAFIGAGILAVSALFVFEAHIAKTDAMLCGLSTIVLACMLRLRIRPDGKIAIVFWAALAGAVMIKGPITPTLVIFTLAALFVLERQAQWMRALFSIPGIIIALLMILPWSIMIGLETNGAFFTDAIGGDLAPKLAGGQEKHGAPPGYYLATLPVLFWPGSLFLLCGLVFGVRAAKRTQEDSAVLPAAMRLLICWTVPFWIMLEIVPTKLPNYLLPVYPALSLMCAASILTLLQVETFKRSRKIGAIIFFIVSILLVLVVLSGEALYAPQQSFAQWISITILALIFIATGSLWTGRVKAALISALAATLMLTPLTYQFILPKLDHLRVSDNVEAALTQAGITLPRCGGPQILSPHFTEPSLVYRLGTSILLGDKTDAILAEPLNAGTVLLMDTAQTESDSALQMLKTDNCFEEIGHVKGLNYSKGDEVNITIFQAQNCPAVSLTVPSNLPE